jgi:hypothetical protein
MVSVNEQLPGHRVDSPFPCGGERDIVEQQFAGNRGKEMEVHHTVRPDADIEAIVSVLDIQDLRVDDLSETPLRLLRPIDNVDGVLSWINHAGRELAASAEDPAVEA